MRKNNQNKKYMCLYSSSFEPNDCCFENPFNTFPVIYCCPWQQIYDKVGADRSDPALRDKKVFYICKYLAKWSISWFADNLDNCICSRLIRMQIQLLRLIQVLGEVGFKKIFWIAHLQKLKQTYRLKDFFLHWHNKVFFLGKVWIGMP